MTHQYIKITEIDRPLATNTMRGTPGALVVCAVCGEVKHVWSTGEIQIIKEGDKNCGIEITGIATDERSDD